VIIGNQVEILSSPAAVMTSFSFTVGVSANKPLNTTVFEKANLKRQCLSRKTCLILVV